MPDVAKNAREADSADGGLGGRIGRQAWAALPARVRPLEVVLPTRFATGRAFFGSSENGIGESVRVVGAKRTDVTR
jgi:hypothetical protein